MVKKKNCDFEENLADKRDNNEINTDTRYCAVNSKSVQRVKNAIPMTYNSNKKSYSLYILYFSHFVQYRLKCDCWL